MFLSIVPLHCRHGVSKQMSISSILPSLLSQVDSREERIVHNSRLSCPICVSYETDKVVEA